jgi:cobalt-zinc-cadmium resistance protein CzcA
MIKMLIRTALKQRIVVAVLAAALFAFGLSALQKLSVDAFPDVTNVLVQVATEAPGRPPDEVERLVTIPIEIIMTGLPGLTEMRSLNRSGLSIITLVFTDSTDVYFARHLVLERLIEVADRLPEGITPVLGPVSTGLGEVYQYTLERPDDGTRPLTVAELTERRTIQDWVVRPMLRNIPGVAEINSQGGFVKQYQVLVKPDRLRHYNIRGRELFRALAINNANAGGGILPRYAEQYLIRGVGLIRNVEDIGNIVLKEVGATPVYVRDVADVTIGHEVRQGAIVKNGRTEGVTGIVMMLRGGNAREVVGRVKAKVNEINKKGLLPGGLRIVPFYDRTELVDAALHSVSKVLLEAVVLVIVMLFLFLGDIRSSLIVVVTLLLSPFLTFMVMNHYKLSANLMSLGGLAIALGLIVDGSVVVVENAFRQLGQRPDQSRLRVVLDAAAEVGTPVLFGVGIIILVFLPLMSLQGMEGKMFAPLAYTVAIALVMSLILSLTLTPALSSYLLKGGKDHETKLLAFLKKPYLKALHFALGNSWLTILGAAVLLIAALAVIPLLGTAFIPTLKEGTITPGIIRVPSISLDEAIRVEMEAMKRIVEIPGVRMAVSKVGKGESPADPAGPNESDPVVSLVPRDRWPKGWTQESFEEAIRAKLASLPGIQLVMNQPIAARVDEMITGVRSQVAIKLFGEDLDVLKQTGDEIARVLKGIPGSTDLRVERLTGQEYLNIIIDRKAIARHGLNVDDINWMIETAIGGKTVTQVYERERRFKMVVRLPEIYRNNPETIEKLMLVGPSGGRVALKDLAQISLADGPSMINREGGRRRIVIGCNVTGRDLGGFVAEAQARVELQVRTPEGYSIVWGGQFENMQRAMQRLMLIIPITIGLIFFLLFMLFNSIRLATLIIFILPFASIGGVFSLLISGEYLSVPASIGFIALWGIAVLNGVVLVSYIRSLRHEGLDQTEAVIQGCTQRFRPVLMTATVAMLGMVPMVLSSGVGAEVQRPLAVVVIGGLFTSTLLTLVVLPCLYRWFEEKRLEAGEETSIDLRSPEE